MYNEPVIFREWKEITQVNENYDVENTYQDVFFNRSNKSDEEVSEILNQFITKDGFVDHKNLNKRGLYIPRECSKENLTGVKIFDVFDNSPNMIDVFVTIRGLFNTYGYNYTVPAPQVIWAATKTYPSGQKFSFYFYNDESATRELNYLKTKENDESCKFKLEMIPYPVFRSWKLKDQIFDTNEWHDNINWPRPVYIQKNNNGQVVDSGPYAPVEMPLIRRTFPQLFSDVLVGVQPISTPCGIRSALRYLNNKPEKVKKPKSGSNYTPPKKKKKK